MFDARAFRYVEVRQVRPNTLKCAAQFKKIYPSCKKDFFLRDWNLFVERSVCSLWMIEPAGKLIHPENKEDLRHEA
jgi:hypothetical protein